MTETISFEPDLRESADRKETNPKDAVGIGKAPMSTLSWQVMAEVDAAGLVPNRGHVLLEVGVAMLEGALKYGRHNYRVAGVRASVYFDAVFRHRFARGGGQHIDPESGMPHIVKEIAGLMVLRDSMLQGNWVDDRPPRSRNKPWGPNNFLESWWEGGTDLLVVTELLRLMKERGEALGGDPVDAWMPELNAKAKALVEKYPNPVPACTAVEQSKPIHSASAFKPGDGVQRCAGTKDDRYFGMIAGKLYTVATVRADGLLTFSNLPGLWSPHNFCHAPSACGDCS